MNRNTPANNVKKKERVMLHQLPPSKDDKPRNIFIIPEYGSRFMTERLVASILKSNRHPEIHTGYIVVGDDGYFKAEELDASLFYVDAKPTGIELRYPDNVQYAENVNRIIRWALPVSNDFLFIINTDIIFPKPTIAALCEMLKAEDAIVGPAVLDPKAGVHVQVLDKTMWENQEKVKERCRLAVEDTVITPVGSIKPIRVTALSGCCIAMRTGTWYDLGGFDSKNFKAFFEDDDLCIRAGLSGRRCLVNMNVFVMHKRGATMRRDKNCDKELMPVSRENFEKKWPEISWAPTGLYEVPEISPDDPRIRLR